MLKKSEEKYVIIGNSVAAVAAIESIRKRNKTSQITVISKESYFAYSRPLISYFLEGKIESNQMYYRNNQFYRENNIELILGREMS